MADQPVQEIDVRTRRNGEEAIEVSVSDTGPGIAKADEDRIFGPFVTTKPHGMGLGLSICRSIVEAHTGRIRATASDDRGATIRLTLPVSRQRAGAI